MPFDTNLKAWFMRVRMERHGFLLTGFCLTAAISSLSLSNCNSRPLRDYNVASIGRLSTGDSVEILDITAVTLEDGRRGRLVEFHPFVSIRDTLRLRKIVIALWPVIKPRLGIEDIEFVAMRATTRRRGVVGVVTFDAYGFAAQRRRDGNWYLAGDTLMLP